MLGQHIGFHSAGIKFPRCFDVTHRSENCRFMIYEFVSYNFLAFSIQRFRFSVFGFYWPVVKTTYRITLHTKGTISYIIILLSERNSGKYSVIIFMIFLHIEGVIFIQGSIFCEPYCLYYFWEDILMSYLWNRQSGGPQAGRRLDGCPSCGKCFIEGEWGEVTVTKKVIQAAP